MTLAKGVKPSGKPGVLNYHSNVVWTSTTKRFANWLCKANPALVARLYVTSGKDGKHATNSNHYKGTGLDFGNNADGGKAMGALAAFLYKYSAHLRELIHKNPTYAVKNGKRVSSSYFGSATMNAHANHVHAAATAADCAALEKATGHPAVTVKSRDGSAFPGDVRLNSSGSVAKAWQVELNQDGAKLSTDGHFGSRSVAALKAAQSKYKLSVDGRGGSKTWAKLK